jgi:RND family efflux transporter MFP subunit
MKTLLERLNPKKVGIIVLIILALLIANRVMRSAVTETAAIPEETSKEISTVSFGEWTPDARREITGTISSDSDIEIRAELPGIIEKTYVSIGESVTKGQILATFQKRNDATQISYENLLQQLAVAKIQSAASIRSAETTLENAKNNQEHTKSSEAQNYSRTFDLLRTQARNAESVFRNIIDWTDTRLMVSTSAKANANYEAQQIGQNNSILRQKLKNDLESLLRKRDLLNAEHIPTNISDEDTLRLASERLRLLRETQELTRSFNTLVQNTPVTSSFPPTTKTIYENEATGFVSSIDSSLLALENQIESAKSEQGRNRLSLSGVNNSVQQAESSLSVTKAQAQSQITQLETQLRLARSSQEDLIIRAPFDGNITNKAILSYDQVSAGTPLFSLVGTNVTPKITAKITPDELLRIQTNPKNVSAKLENGDTIPLPVFKISGKLDSITQKLQADFPLDEIPEGLLVGSFVKILLPIDGTISNLLPISAISFEPDGAEVLIVKDGVGERAKVTIGKLISNAVEIESGLEMGTPVVQYRTRAHAGEKLEIRTK